MAKKITAGWNDVTSEGRNEVVFEGRFKEYGAFLVRSTYQRSLLIALGIAVGFGIVSISMPLIIKAIGSHKANDEVRNITVHLTTPPPLNPNTPPPPPPPPPPPKPLINELRVTPPVIAKQVLDTIPPPTVHEVAVTNVGTQNQKGKDTILAPIASSAVIGDPNANQVFTVVQQMPSFNGDLGKYMNDHIQYPEVEKEAGITGKVYVTFVVEKDGTVTGVKLLRGVPGGPGLDKEAIRVVSHMPAWKIGMQNGHPVRVQFNLPINFNLR